MSPAEARSQLLQSLTPELLPSMIGRTEARLLSIVRTNLNTQYASKSTLLARFRDALLVHQSPSDSLLIENFRRCVPLSDYGSYKPFMTAFDKHPCREVELENLFAPGLPFLLAVSSATSGRQPKVFPKYASSRPPTLPTGHRSGAAILFCGYGEVKHVERESGRIVKKIPVSTATAGMTRAILGWTNIEHDDSRMSTKHPGFVAPWAASMINSHKSFLMIHALFALTCPDLDYIMLVFSTLFYDLVRYVDEQWDMFLSSIRTGTVPDLPGVHGVLSHLQVHFHPNPGRAAELSAIGPPFSCEAWAALVWPKLRVVQFGCGGSFATLLPKVKSIIGPTVAIHPIGYGSSESLIAAPFHPDDLDTFVLQSSDLIEFLDVASGESHENLIQAWEVEVGKQYEVVLTTNDGLWRYQLGDIVEIVGFDANDGSPAFLLSHRRSLEIRVGPILISDMHITSAIQAVSPDIIEVNEFTTLLDDRHGTPTLGYLIELAGSLGPNAHLAVSRLSEGLAAAAANFQMYLEEDRVRLPTVRILKSGTFAAYRQWRAEKMNAGPGQVKVPAIISEEASVKWVLERVIEEL